MRIKCDSFLVVVWVVVVGMAVGGEGGGGNGNAGCCQGVSAAERKGSTARRSGRGVWRCRRQYPSIAGACGSGGPGQPGDLAGRPEGGISAGTGERGARHLRHGLVCPGAGGKSVAAPGCRWGRAAEGIPRDRQSVLGGKGV